MVLKRNYTLVAGDLGWYSTWRTVSDLQVIFFEYSDSTAADQVAAVPKKVPRRILTLAFTQDRKTGAFLEALDPAAMDLSNRYDAKENARYIVEISFEGSSDTEARILQCAADIASTYNLLQRTPQPHLVGRLAEYSTSDFSLDVQRYDSANVGVTVQDYGRRELTQAIADEMRLLPGVLRTRRFVSVNIRQGQQSLESVRGGVEKVATRYHLSRVAPRGTFNVTTFGAQDLHLSLDHFERDGLIKVSIEDLGWHPEFAQIEAALRTELLQPAPIDGPNGI